MKVTREQLIRIFLGEQDAHRGRPLHEVLVEEARRHGLAGATVLRGPLGYGHSSRLHTAKILRLADDLPLVLELVDEGARLDRWLEACAPLLRDVLVTRLELEVLTFPAAGGGR